MLPVNYVVIKKVPTNLKVILIIREHLELIILFQKLFNDHLKFIYFTVIIV